MSLMRWVRDVFWHGKEGQLRGVYPKNAIALLVVSMPKQQKAEMTSFVKGQSSSRFCVLWKCSKLNSHLEAIQKNQGSLVFTASWDQFCLY